MFDKCGTVSCTLLYLKELARGTSSGVEDSINLDVHAISELKAKGAPITDDLPKYDYSADDHGNYSKCDLACILVMWLVIVAPSIIIFYCTDEKV